MAYDVFISFKNSDENGRATKDSAIAQRLYDYLSGKGLRVFFSNVELEFLGKAQYTEVIDDALDSSRFLIAVGCSRDNLSSQWVRYEWSGFLNDIRSNIKPNAEVFVLYAGMTIGELPRALRQQQAFDAGDADAMEKLYSFIKNAMRENDDGHAMRGVLGIETGEKKAFRLKNIFGGKSVEKMGSVTETIREPSDSQTCSPKPSDIARMKSNDGLCMANVSNGGRMLQNGIDVYYSKWDGVLYKTEVEKVASNRTAIYRSENGAHITCINMDGSTLYFYEAGKGICKIKTDGTAFQLLESFADVMDAWSSVTTSIPASQMILVEDTLFVRFDLSYYNAANGGSKTFNRLYAVNKDTGKKQLISNADERIKFITVYNGSLYFIVNDDFNDGSIVRIRSGSTMERETVIENLRADSMLLDDDYIYFFRFYDAFMYRSKYDGTGNEKISVDRGDTYFSMDSEWVYYRDGWGKSGGDSKIYAFNKKTSANEAFAAGDIDSSFGFYIIGNQLYYLNGAAIAKKPLL